MDAAQYTDGLSECVARAMYQYITTSDINNEWLDKNRNSRPVLRLEAFLESEDDAEGEKRSVRSERIVAVGMPMPMQHRESRKVPLRGAIVDTFGIATPFESPTPVARSPESEQASPSDNRNASPVPEITGEVQSSCTTISNSSHRNGTGGLRVANSRSVQEEPIPFKRQMQAGTHSLRKRRKADSDKLEFQPSSLDKLIIGIWERIHVGLNLDSSTIFTQLEIVPRSISQLSAQRCPGDTFQIGSSANSELVHPFDSFSHMNLICRKVSQSSQIFRTIELIVQARWVEAFDHQIYQRTASNPEISAARHRKAAFLEACRDFDWSEKELRNRLAIWRGYKELKDAAGWAALVFAGMGIYRFCKYRVSFGESAIERLQQLRYRLEVAADTLNPSWRQLLAVVGESTALQYTGHPHDWVVFKDGKDPVPLRNTYNDPLFSFENVDESIVDDTVWGCEDPRWMPMPTTVTRKDTGYICSVCMQRQSDDPVANSCHCFPLIFGCTKQRLPAVQIFRTSNRNNGLMALTPFECRTEIGEFLGLVTKGIKDVDVLDGRTPLTSYQIWQGRIGNYTRFVNHSCRPNAKFVTFTWTGTERIVLVSKGIKAGEEVCVDYGDSYWKGLNKVCLCGESCCRYRRES